LFSVTTWNIRYDVASDAPYHWAGRLPYIEKQFSDEAASDILALQEVLPRQWEDLQVLFPEHSSVGRGRDADGGGEHCVLFYRRERFELLQEDTFWLSPTPGCHSRGWDACLPRICTWARLRDRSTKQELRVWNVHLDHLGQQARVQGLKLLVGRIGASRSILLGDFNTTLQKMPGGLRDCHPSLGGTYHEFDGALNGPRIDYILASEHFRSLDGGRILPQQPGDYISDHYPVWADLV